MSRQQQQDETTGTVYGIPTSEWVKLDKAGMREVKRNYEADVRKRNLEASNALLEADLKRRQDKAQADEAARQEAARTRAEAELRRSYLANGGTAEDFEKVKDRLISERIEARTLAEADRSKQAVRRRVARAI
jgi:hypothetical protein